MPERPETPLLAELRRLIQLEGPLPLDRYMALCLGHPAHGYYVTRDPLGQAGDFTTAPEISQMFGEMIGVWAMSVWSQMGRPARFDLVELGPGRGTLMADALRSAKALPGFLQAARPVLVETSPALRAVQEKALAGAGARWVRDVAEIGSGPPKIVLANEFFDALPIRQFVRVGSGWRERLVGLDENGGLAFGLSAEAVADMRLVGEEGAVREAAPLAGRIMGELAAHVASAGGAILAIDYGAARSAAGDSFQAMKGHAFVNPLEDPGGADLTAHVDFEALAAAGKAAGGVVLPLLTQKTLLERLGIVVRAEALTRAAPARGAEIAAALSRLTGAGEGAMGTLFKALCVAAPGLGAPPAFDRPDPVLQQLLA